MKTYRSSGPVLLAGVLVAALIGLSRDPSPKANQDNSTPPITRNTAGPICDHPEHHGHHPPSAPRTIERLSLSEIPAWIEAPPGQQASLGFRLGEDDHALVTGRHEFPDGRVAIAMKLPHHDLHLVMLGDRWEGRALSRDGRTGWILGGDGGTVSLTEVPHEELICSVVDENGIQIAGLPAEAGDDGSPTPRKKPGTDPEPINIPILESLPGANGVIYLDFDGETVSGTQWNSSYNGNQDIVAEAAGLDEAGMQRVWAGMAEDYRPLNVNITTDRSVYESYPIERRAMMIFTPTSDWYATSGVGGVALTDTFHYTYNESPGWVFTGALSYSPENCQEAGSHEAGHILGLSHDGTSSGAYYAGHGTGATSWAPIMGLSYNAAVSHWSCGEYPDANNLQDDLEILSRPLNGLGYRTDDHAGSLSGATAITDLGGGILQAAGLIESRSDLDVHCFRTAGGSVSFSVTNGDTDPNLDLRVRLLDTGGNEIAVADPADSLDAAINTTAPAGLLYLEISGTGTGDLVTGYSDYSSLGGYTISGTAPPAPDLEAQILSPADTGVSLPLGTGLVLEGLATGGAPSWSIVSAPQGATVELSSAGSTTTLARFSDVGLYTVRFTADDGVSPIFDEVQVSVESPGTTPLFAAVAPSVDLGSDRSIDGDRVTLTASVSDDGLPGAITCEWEVLSGDASLTDPLLDSPDLVFSSSSEVLVRMTASDGLHRTFDEVRLTASFAADILVGPSTPASAYAANMSTMGSAWKTAGFNDSLWVHGTIGAGYAIDPGDGSMDPLLPLIQLDVRPYVAGSYSGCLVRVPFEIADPSAILSLNLKMRYDDGFVAYLNGVEIARANIIDGEPSWMWMASADRPDLDASTPENFAIDLASAPLVAGTNVLAIHGMNSIVYDFSAGAPDSFMLIEPTLEGVIASAPESPFVAAMSAIADPGLRGPLDDADGDGRPNLYEHATGTDPTGHDEAYQVARVENTDTILLTLPADPPADVRCVLEHSEVLGDTWNVLAQREGSGPWQGTTPVQTTTAPETRETIEFPMPDPTAAVGFFRLRFELIAP